MNECGLGQSHKENFSRDYKVILDSLVNNNYKTGNRWLYPSPKI